MVNYGNSKIYKVVNSINNKIYIGSTTRMLCRRWAEHLADSRNKKKYINELHKDIKKLGAENFKIVLIHRFPCENKEELYKEEERVRQTFDKKILYSVRRAIYDGSVYYFAKKNIWVFKWVNVFGDRQAKQFAVGKYGDLAELYAIHERIKMFY